MRNQLFAVRSWLLLIGLVATCAGPLPTPASAQPVTNLNVMSFNVLVAGQRGLANIAEAIRRSGADVVGLQEIASSPAAITQLATNLNLLAIMAPYPRLQRATTLSPADWQDVAGTLGADSYAEPKTNAATFFRLLQQ